MALPALAKHSSLLLMARMAEPQRAVATLPVQSVPVTEPMNPIAKPAPVRPTVAASTTAVPRRSFSSIVGSVAGTIAIGGHRGMGENMLKAEALLPAYRENTVTSFLRAAESGANFIEFDVQVTADGVPVIWHDDFAMWKGEDGALHRRQICQLTLAEFKNLTVRRTASEKSEAALLRQFKDDSGVHMTAPSEWRCLVDDELPTLAEVFERVPEHIGFDVEVKMTGPHTQATTPPAEVDCIVSSILRIVQRSAMTSNRTIVFSSFDPEVCLALRQRQQSVPVMFLSNGGTSWHIDSRRTSIESAISFAISSALQGIVVDTGALRQQQGMVSLAHNAGLEVVTYGLQNDDPEWVKEQYRLGVEAAIVDDVTRVVPAFAAIEAC